jgi:ribA/ribD-fused uncharacterized protein
LTNTPKYVTIKKVQESKILNFKSLGKESVGVKIINKFAGKYHFLDNFYPSPIKLGEFNFNTVENAFQAFKTKDLEVFRVIAKTKLPGYAKILGNAVVLRKDWEEIKVFVMYLLVYKKFSQNPKLLQKLLDTENIYLEEGNTWGDTIWGTVGGKGQNLLGRILMEVRSLNQ